MRRKVILFGPLPPPFGGVAIYMKALAQHCRSFDVRVWTYTGEETNESARYIPHRSLGTFPALINEGRGARILDNSHFHLEYPNLLLLTVWLTLKKFLGFEWYKNIHDGSLPKRYPHFGMMQRWMFKRAVRAVDEFVVVSEELRRWLKEELDVSQPITVISALLPLVEEAAGLSAKTNQGVGSYLAREKRVCCIGVFYFTYGFKDVAFAVEQLRSETGQDIGLLLVDGGFVRDENYRADVLKGREWITVLEEVPNRGLHEILRRSDVFVRGFADESYGLSRIEAIWCGLPVVATRAGETRGMLLYDFGDQAELARQLKTALLGPRSPEIAEWASRYRREAQANLEAITQLLGLGDHPPTAKSNK